MWLLFLRMVVNDVRAHSENGVHPIPLELPVHLLSVPCNMVHLNSGHISVHVIPRRLPCNISLIIIHHRCLIFGSFTGCIESPNSGCVPGIQMDHSINNQFDSSDAIQLNKLSLTCTWGCISAGMIQVTAEAL